MLPGENRHMISLNWFKCDFFLYLCHSVGGSDVKSPLFLISHPPLCLIMDGSKTLFRRRRHQTFGHCYLLQKHSDAKIFSPGLITVLCLWSVPRWHLRGPRAISATPAPRYLCKGTSGHFEHITKSIVYKHALLTFGFFVLFFIFWWMAAILESNQSQKYRQCRTVNWCCFFFYGFKCVWGYFKYLRKELQVSVLLACLFSFVFFTTDTWRMNLNI